MSLIENVLDRIQTHYAEKERDRHPYLYAKPTPFFFGQEWALKQRNEGCRPVKAQAAIAMDKNPAPLPGVTPPKPATLTPPPQSRPSSIPLTPEAARERAAREARQPKQEQQLAADPRPEEDCPQPPPFDMLDLPEGMDAMGFKYAADCARRWFNGKAHVIVDGSSDPVAPEFVDTDSFKLDWILKFGHVRWRYEHLLATGLKPDAKSNIYSDKAKKELLGAMKSFMAQRNYRGGTLDTLAKCGNDKQVLHQRFQFQLIYVSMLNVLGGFWQVVGQGLAMNDLAAAIGNFNLYAAVASASILSAPYNNYRTRACSQ
ncbi:DUF6402 family protein [Azonexus sp.]|jgi:hypothetical protein|uniref:DUF6402 family protein n=1 Tax=Azonexus sp. TaxID=1872668 RepID=UPI00282F66FB|nr:DUF6402 family protein [Azonexus sp.]MDR1995228.1 DUF6402 family protein [Azonexus sp.]